MIEVDEKIKNSTYKFLSDAEESFSKGEYNAVLLRVDIKWFLKKIMTEIGKVSRPVKWVSIHRGFLNYRLDCLLSKTGATRIQEALIDAFKHELEFFKLQNGL